MLFCCKIHKIFMINQFCYRIWLSRFTHFVPPKVLAQQAVCETFSLFGCMHNDLAFDRLNFGLSRLPRESGGGRCSLVKLTCWLSCRLSSLCFLYQIIIIICLSSWRFHQHFFGTKSFLALVFHLTKSSPGYLWSHSFCNYGQSFPVRYYSNSISCVCVQKLSVLPRNSWFLWHFPGSRWEGGHWTSRET